MKFKSWMPLLAASLLLMTTAAFAAPEKLNFGSQLNAAQCQPGGKLVVNVSGNVLNTADSGVSTPVWAFDDLNRQIQVWQTAPNTFCVSVKNHGSWETVAGPSPMGLGTINAGISGTMEGGYTAVVTGTLKAVPGAKTRGNIGSVDYACDTSGNCPGRQNWVELYFEPGFTFTYTWWGWIYHGGQNGTWVNASTPPGNSGDIHN